MHKVLVLGDGITDVHRFGKVSRLCPEAPVPVFAPEREEVRRGGMWLVADNLKAFGLDVTELPLSYSVKTRYWAGRHLLLREDEDAIEITRCMESLAGYDAIVISDYAKGGVSDSLARGLPILGNVFIDTKRPDPDVYRGCYAMFPNEAEYGRCNGIALHTICKRGAQGCDVDGTPVPTEAQEAFDVTGAGDVFLAAFVAAHLRGNDLIECAQVANHAAGISVKHIGGYVLTPEEANESLRRVAERV